MLQRLLFGLITVTSLTLVGCAHSPQQLSPQPKITTQLAAVGHGQPVSVRVVDGRPSPTLGTRGGLYPETSAITVTGADVLPKLQAQAEAAVRLLGFTPSGNSPGAPQLTITLAELKYQSPKEGLYVTEATIGATFKSDVSAGNRRYSGRYGSRFSRSRPWRPAPPAAASRASGGSSRRGTGWYPPAPACSGGVGAWSAQEVDLAAHQVVHGRCSTFVRHGGHVSLDRALEQQTAQV